jgi:hypothetical protein
MQATGMTQDVTRSALLTITNFMNITLPGLEKREYLRLRDFLLKLARGYDEQRGIARVYITKREQYYFKTEPQHARILRMWTPRVAQPAGESEFTLAPGFLEHYGQHAAHALQQRQLHEQAEARRADRSAKRASRA